MNFIGRFGYIVAYPLIKLVLDNTRRSYVVIECGGRFLFTKNWLGTHKEWRLPGGGLKTKEDYRDAVVRELQEETGILVLKNQLKPINIKQRRFAYFYIRLKSQPILLLQKPEILDAKFIELKRLASYKIDKRVLEVLGRLK